MRRGRAGDCGTNSVLWVVVLGAAVVIALRTNEPRPAHPPPSPQSVRAQAIRARLADSAAGYSPAQRAGMEQAATEIELGIALWDPLSQRGR